MNKMEMVKAQLKDEIIRAITDSPWAVSEQVPDIIIEIPKDKTHGDFTTNIAMQWARLQKQNPRHVAEQLIARINQSSSQISSIDIAGPGFINFKMNKSFLYPVLHDVFAKGDRYGEVDIGKGKRVQVEFVSANPTGSLHLGHARGAAFGDSLCNILDYAGYEVTREYYINDAGNQIENLANSIEARYKQRLGQAAEMPEDGYHGQDIKEIAEELYVQHGDACLRWTIDERLQVFRSYGLQRELDKIKADLARFGVNFNSWYSESSIYTQQLIPDVLLQLQQQGHTYEQDGATWLKTTPFGDDKDRVLKKNDGTFTYLTPDIAYHRDKYLRGYDHMINIWGADHHGYIPRVKAAMSALGYDANKLTVIIAQMVSLFSQGEKVKMSKRTGKAVTMEDLMDEVGVDAIRYFFAMRSADSHLDFDMDLAVSQSNDNPVFYVQYAYARISSIFRQAEEQGIAWRTDQVQQVDLTYLVLEAEYELLRKIGEFPEEVAGATEQYAPHRIVRYVYELASQFHSYYKAERVITEDAQLTRARLALLSGLRTTLANAMRIVGVSAPERM
jgi:arginyl-tRNA synthetase